MPDEDWELFFPGNEYPDEQQGHLAVLLESFRIYHDRDAVRGDMWRQFPPSDKLRMIREKLTRAEAAYDLIQRAGASPQMVKEYEDSLLDLINFAVFGIRQLREGASG